MQQLTPYKINHTIPYQILQQNIAGHMGSVHMKAQIETTNLQIIRIPQPFEKNHWKHILVHLIKGVDNINDVKYI